jgi:hypothetical protein
MTKRFAALSGEWWLDETGNEQYADGDVGDYNHAFTALSSALGVDLEDPSAPEIIAFDSLSEQAVKWLLENGASPEAVEYFKNGADPRDYAVEQMGWIRIAGDNAQCFNFDQNALERIADFACSQLEEMGLDPAQAGSIYVEEGSTGGTWSIQYALLCKPGIQVEAVKHLSSGIGKFRGLARWVSRNCRFAKGQGVFDWYSPYEHFPTMTGEELAPAPEPTDEDSEGPPKLVFHGTTRSKFGKIVSQGLVPGSGEFVGQFYGEDGEKVEDLLYLATPEDLGKAFNAIIFQVGKEAGSDWPYDTVTADDVIRNGVLLAVNEGPGMYLYDNPNYGESTELETGDPEYETPSSVESGDVWTREEQSPSMVMTGPALIRAMMEYDVGLYKRLLANEKRAK